MTLTIISHDFNVAKAILEDVLFKSRFDKNNVEDIKKLKLLKAREENIDFEMELAEMICGDNNSFPYRSSFFMTKFFQDLGINFSHDGTTRRFWMKDVLKELNIHQISYIIECGLFRKKDYRNQNFRTEENKSISDEDFYNGAISQFRQFINESISINEKVDLSTLLELNLNIELLFDRPAMTKDNELNELIKEAKSRFLNPNDKQIALEKLWDAFERVKTYFSSDKKSSAMQLIELISGDLEKLHFEDVFQKFTKIGNDYRIRHHETNKKEITDTKHIDYLFFSMLSLLDLCLTALNQ